MSAVMMLKYPKEDARDAECGKAAVRIRAPRPALERGEKTRDLGGTLDPGVRGGDREAVER
jgi:hypothetical protein